MQQLNTQHIFHPLTQNTIIINKLLNLVRKPFLVCWKRHTSLVYKFEFEKFFPLFNIISSQRSYVYQKLDINSCFAKLRAISNLFSFFLYTLYILYMYCFNSALRWKDVFRPTIFNRLVFGHFCPE